MGDGATHCRFGAGDCIRWVYCLWCHPLHGCCTCQRTSTGRQRTNSIKSHYQHQRQRAQIPSFTIINTSASNGIITTGTGFPCLVLDTPQSEAVATPTDKRGFITPIHKAGSGTPTASRYGYGRDALTRKDSGTASDVCLTSRPPFALRPAAGGLFNIPEGI